MFSDASSSHRPPQWQHRSAPRRKCDSYEVVETNLARSQAYVRIFDVDRTGGRPTTDEQELLRGAVVFSIGALDAFLHELALEIVPQFRGNRSVLNEALRAIAKDDLSLPLRMVLSPNGDQRVEAFRATLDDWRERKSFQGAARVANALTDVGSPV